MRIKTASTILLFVAVGLMAAFSAHGATNVTYVLTWADPGFGTTAAASSFAVYQNATNIVNLAASATGTNTWTTPPVGISQQFIWGVQSVNMAGTSATSTVTNTVLLPPVAPALISLQRQ